MLRMAQYAAAAAFLVWNRYQDLQNVQLSLLLCMIHVHKYVNGKSGPLANFGECIWPMAGHSPKTETIHIWRVGEC